MVEQKSRFGHLRGNGQWENEPSLDKKPETLIEKLGTIYIPKRGTASAEQKGDTNEGQTATDQQAQINTLLENLFKSR